MLRDKFNKSLNSLQQRIYNSIYEEHKVKPKLTKYILTQIRYIERVLNKNKDILDRGMFEILGYGSILSLKSAQSSFGVRVNDLGFEYITGYKRVFNAGWDNTAYLNIEYDGKTTIVCRRYELDFNQFIAYIQREALYTIQYDTGVEAYYAIANSPKKDLLPKLDYTLYICIADLNTEQLENFWNTTFNADGMNTQQFIKRIVDVGYSLN